jgi:hypothetical protein
LRTCAPGQVFCPLGVGTHVDHRLTYRAAVAVRGFDRLTFYEDRPYVLVAGQLAMRLAELSLQSDVPLPAPADFLTSFRAARYVRTYLHDDERGECEAMLLEKLLAAPAVTGRLRAETLASSRIDDVLGAIALYETQLPDLYGDIDGLRRESLRYTAGLGQAVYAERYWQGSAIDTMRRAEGSFLSRAQETT